jgi:hypothetical protein
MQIYALTRSNDELVGLYTTEAEALVELQAYHEKACHNGKISLWTPGEPARSWNSPSNVLWYMDQKDRIVQPERTEDPEFRNRYYGTLDVTRMIKPKKNYGFTFIGYRGNMGSTEDTVRQNFDALYFKGAYDAVKKAPGAETWGSADYSFCLKVKNKYFDELVLAKMEEV